MLVKQLLISITGMGIVATFLIFGLVRFLKRDHITCFIISNKVIKYRVLINDVSQQRLNFMNEWRLLHQTIFQKLITSFEETSYFYVDKRQYDMHKIQIKASNPNKKDTHLQ